MQDLDILQGEPFPFPLASSFSNVILKLGELTGTLLPQKPLQWPRSGNERPMGWSIFASAPLHCKKRHMALCSQKAGPCTLSFSFWFCCVVKSFMRARSLRWAQSLCRDQFHPYGQAQLSLNLVFMFSKHQRGLLQFFTCESAILIPAVTPQDVQLWETLH